MQTDRKSKAKLAIWQFYKKLYKRKVSIKFFRAVLNIANQKIVNKLYEGKQIILPYKLGTLYISQSIPSYKFTDNGELDFIKSSVGTDWGATKKLWIAKPETANKVYLVYENLNTSGYRMKVKWVPNYKNHVNISMMQFSPVRSFKRGLAKYINANNKMDYLVK